MMLLRMKMKMMLPRHMTQAAHRGSPRRCHRAGTFRPRFVFGAFGTFGISAGAGCSQPSAPQVLQRRGYPCPGHALSSE